MHAVGRKMMTEPYIVEIARLKGGVAAVVINLRSRDCHIYFGVSLQSLTCLSAFGIFTYSQIH